MKGEAKTVLAVITILLAVSSITVFALFTVTSSPTTLFVDPPSIEDPTILPGETITIRIMIDSVINMKTCNFNLTFNPVVLSVQRVTKQQVSGQFPKMTMDEDDSAGYIAIGLLYTTSVTISTNTSLVEIEFYVKDYGTSPLHFDSSDMRDGSGNPIPHGTQDGFVRIFMRNIIVQEITFTVIETYVGRTIPINVTVLNDGDIPETFNVSLFYDTTLIEKQPVVDLAPKTNITLNFFWDTTGVAPSLTPYTIKAEATILPHETNTLDNTLIGGTIKLKIIGDVNGDGTVNIDDLIAWDAAYGTHPGEPHWNEQADINNDGVVNEADAQLILDHYHETI